MNANVNDPDEAIAKLNKLLDDEAITIFTKEEVIELREMVNAWRSAKGFVKISRLAGGTLKWFVGVGLAWAAFKAGLFDSIHWGTSGK